jgi:hypothetical protein
MSVAGQNTRLPLLKQNLAAIAVVFDFVNPVMALGRLIDWRSKLRFNEPELCGYAKHGGYLG